MKVALIHDYLFEYGGAERVLEALHELYPDAPVYTSFVDRDRLGVHWSKFADWDIRESWMTKIPLYKTFVSPLRLLAMHFFEQFDLSEYDLVISSSNAYFAKAVITKSWVPHICYCHTPPRSLYGYSTQTDWQRGVVTRTIGNWINSQIKEADYMAAQRVDYFVANSQEVKKRIRKFYRRDAIVINPPVDVPELLDKKHGEYFLYVNRLAFAKHPEIAVQAASELDIPLKVVGTGKMLDQLKTLAGPKVEFLGAVSDERLHKLYADASGLLYPVEDEDFGIVPVEAMGYGIPVIAHNSGGPKETIEDGKTGILFDDLSVNGLKKAIAKFEKTKWNSTQIHEHSLSYTKVEFQRKFSEFVNQVMANHDQLLEEQIVLNED